MRARISRSATRRNSARCKCSKMLEALVISQIALWVLLLVMAGLQLALLRQIGVIHERIAPMGALTLDHGPKEGESSPIFDLVDIGKRRVKIGGVSASGK